MNKRDRMIERWEQLIRVLRELPAHEKKKHFNMGVWITKTKCGTVACAAGWAGLDPWFRRRGLKVQLDDCTLFPQHQPHTFFDSRGYHLILVNARQRSVGVVIREIKRHVKWLRTDSDWEFPNLMETYGRNPYDAKWEKWNADQLRGRVRSCLRWRASTHWM